MSDISVTLPAELYKKLQKYENYEIEYARYLDGQSRAAALAGLVLSYDDVYTQSKREAGVLDYDDLEHYALKVLEQEDACAAVREKYRYVFVDEYQDVNPAQDGILSKICSSLKPKSIPLKKIFSLPVSFF